MTRIAAFIISFLVCGRIAAELGVATVCRFPAGRVPCTPEQILGI